MKILVTSDLHLDFHRDGGRGLIRSLPKEVCLMAGDISASPHLLASLAMACEHFPLLIYVNGNHDLYMSNPAELAEMRRIATERHANLRWLNRSTTEIEGVRVVGATLWFPPSDAPEGGMNDFCQIRSFKPWVWQEHERDMEFLRSTLGQDDVLLTHHFPLRQSIPPEYAHSQLNPFFWSGQAAEDLVLLRMPKLAVHGHTHDCMSYEVGGMRVVCNPHGYPGENAAFDFGCIVEV